MTVFQPIFGVLDGGQEMLEEIERRGLAWGIVTNKPGWLTAPILALVAASVMVSSRPGSFILAVFVGTQNERPKRHSAGTARLHNNRKDCHGQVHDNQAAVCRVVEMTHDVDALTAAIWTLPRRTK